MAEADAQDGPLLGVGGSDEVSEGHDPLGGIVVRIELGARDQEPVEAIALLLRPRRRGQPSFNLNPLELELRLCGGRVQQLGEHLKVVSVQRS